MANFYAAITWPTLYVATSHAASGTGPLVAVLDRFTVPSNSVVQIHVSMVDDDVMMIDVILAPLHTGDD